jgi:hypothetical protein
MRTAQYLTAEKQIVAADGGGIWERWRYGLRLLADPEYISNGNGGGLQHGSADRLIAAAQAKGLTLSQRELQNRLQCARTYRTESQMRNIISRFATWFALVQARFPAIEGDPDEPPADYRTATERRHAMAQQLMLSVGDQGRLFPPDDFEPAESTLKELLAYADEQDEITARFAKVGRERRKYLTTLSQAVDYDLSQTWRAAHLAAFGSEPDLIEVD